MSEPMICEPGGKGLVLPLFPEENDIAYGPRSVAYGCFLGWLFLGVAVIADIFMTAIERITSQEKKVYMEVKGANKPFFVRLWNPTVANLTLMALGSSAPEILLSVIELFSNKMYAGALGPSTIVGSAAFNLLVIIGICVMAIPNGETRKVNDMGVYVCTAIASVLSYVWLVFILNVTTPNMVEVWEGVATFVAFPILVLLSYLLDIGFFSKASAKKAAVNSLAQANVLGMKQDKEAGAAAVHPSVLAKLVKEVKDEAGGELTAQKLSELVSLKMEALQLKSKSRAYYRVQATRELVAAKKVGGGGGGKVPGLRIGGAGGYQQLKDEEMAERGDVRNKSPGEKKKKPSSIACVEFACANYRVQEDCGTCVVSVTRSGNMNCTVTCKYETVDGSAKDKEDYIAVRGELTFGRNETTKEIHVKIVDDNVYEPDETFDIVLSEVASDYYASPAELGTNGKTTITIIDDDFPGILSFQEPELTFIESCGHAVLNVERTGGSKGVISCEYRTVEDSAIAGADFVETSGVLEFQPGEAQKSIKVPIIDDAQYEKNEAFRVVLENCTGGAMFGYGWQSTPLTQAVCEVSIKSDDVAASTVELIQNIIKIPFNVHAIEFGASSWGEQFADAIAIGGGDEDGPPPGLVEWIFHLASLPWKVTFAFVPPVVIFDGKLTFIISLTFIGLVTAVIGDAASLFGCVLGLPDAITAITFVAMGTSLPDTFASKTAAVQDQYADASIVNVTGSNAVNVLLGLGLPWMIGAIYWFRKGPTDQWAAAYPAEAALYPDGGFVVIAGDLVFSVTVFIGCAFVCFGMLSVRRITVGYELGGAAAPKYLYGFCFVSLWGVYIALSCWSTLKNAKGA